MDISSYIIRLQIFLKCDLPQTTVHSAGCQVLRNSGKTLTKYTAESQLVPLRVTSLVAWKLVDGFQTQMRDSLLNQDKSEQYGSSLEWFYPTCYWNFGCNNYVVCWYGKSDKLWTSREIFLNLFLNINCLVRDSLSLNLLLVLFHIL